ncbi:MAG: PDZ domain-containing protein, partial [Pirellulaceae bacterium]|nr:PDZ domain-containing protein [Pirellulaceae bacterium]
MMAKKLFATSVFALALLAPLAAPSLTASSPSATGNPDFTQGDKIPEGARHDWNLGATGARGWMFSDKLVTTDARQIYVTEVGKDSPADGILAVGDVILGVGGKPFSYDPRTEFFSRMSILLSYGAHAKTVIPQLTKIGDYFEKEEKNFPRELMLMKAKCVRETIRAIEASTDAPKLKRLQ